MAAHSVRKTAMGERPGAEHVPLLIASAFAGAFSYIIDRVELSGYLRQCSLACGKQEMNHENQIPRRN